MDNSKSNECPQLDSKLRSGVDPSNPTHQMPANQDRNKLENALNLPPLCTIDHEIDFLNLKEETDTVVPDGGQCLGNASTKSDMIVHENVDLNLRETDSLVPDGLCFGKSSTKSMKSYEPEQKPAFQNLQNLLYNGINPPVCHIQGNNNIVCFNNGGIPPNLLLSHGSTNKTSINGDNRNVHVSPSATVLKANVKKAKTPIKVPTGVIPEKVCLKVSMEISSRWKNLGICLGLSENELETIQIDHDRYGCQEQCYQMLLCWREKKGPEATYEKLGRGLLNCKRADVAKKLNDFKDRDKK